MKRKRKRIIFIVVLCELFVILLCFYLLVEAPSSIHYPSMKIAVRADLLYCEITSIYDSKRHNISSVNSNVNSLSFNMIDFRQSECFIKISEYFDMSYLTNDWICFDDWGNPYNIGIRGVTMASNIFNSFFGEDEEDVVVWSSGENGINEYGQNDDILNSMSIKERLRRKEWYKKNWWKKYILW